MARAEVYPGPQEDADLEDRGYDYNEDTHPQTSPDPDDEQEPPSVYTSRDPVVPSYNE